MRPSQVIVGVHGTPGSLEALRFAAEEARREMVTLTAVYAWTPPGGELADRRSPSIQLRRLWQRAAEQRLDNAFDDAFGVVPGDLDCRALALRGEPGTVLVDLAGHPTDLLVVGAGRRGRGRMLHRSIGRYCIGHACCPVVTIPSPEFVEQMRGARGLLARYRLRGGSAGLTPAG